MERWPLPLLVCSWFYLRLCPTCVQFTLCLPGPTSACCCLFPLLLLCFHESQCFLTKSCRSLCKCNLDASKEICTAKKFMQLCKTGPITSPPHLIFQFWRYYFPLLGTSKFLFVFLPTCCTWQPRLIDQEIRPCLLCESLWSFLLGLTVRTNWSCPWHGVVPTLFDLLPCKWARPGVSTHSLVVEQADANYKRFSCICHFLWICLKKRLLHWQVLQGLSFYDIVCMCVIANTKSPFQILNLEMLKKPWILQRINAEMSPPQCKQSSLPNYHPSQCHRQERDTKSCGQLLCFCHSFGLVWLRTTWNNNPFRA